MIIDSTVTLNWSYDQFRTADFADYVQQKSEESFEFDLKFGHRYPAESERLDDEVHNYIVELAQMMWDLKLSELVEIVLAKPDCILGDVFFRSFVKEGIFEEDDDWTEWSKTFGDYVTAKHIWKEANGFRGL